MTHKFQELIIMNTFNFNHIWDNKDGEDNKSMKWLSRNSLNVKKK